MKKRKNANYKISFEKEKETQKTKKNNFLIIFVCIFVSIAIIVASALAITSAVKNANALVKYEGLTMDRELVNFFVSYYKYKYMSMLNNGGVDVEDTESFWNTKCNTINTYGEFLVYNTREYIKQLIVANYLYDSYARLSADEKSDIKLAAREILVYHADNDVATFNAATEKYGFTYSVMEDAARMIYKASRVKSVIYGTNGANIASDAAFCEEYLGEYSHVKLLFIRTENDLLRDENGELVVGDDNSYVTVTLTAEEKAERLAVIEEIREAIALRGTDADGQMDEAMFETYLARYGGGDPDKDAEGYYFHADSDFTSEFSEAFADVVKTALDMDKYSFAEAECSVGVCFIYRYDAEAGAYADTSDDGCFLDFYANAAAAHFDAAMEKYCADVVLTELFDEIDVVAMPYNSVYAPTF